MYRKLKFVFQAIWHDNKRLLVVSTLQIPLRVFLPWVQIFLTRTLVEGIEKQYHISRYLAIICSIFLLQILLTAVKKWMAASVEWDSKLLVHSMLEPLDEKTLTTDYGNVEGMDGQQLRKKALNAAYTFGQSAITAWISFMVNLCGLVFYGLTVGGCAPFVLIIVTATTLGEYFISIQLHKYEQKQKDILVDCDTKMKYLENEGTFLQSAREIRLYDMSAMLTDLYRANMERRMKSTGKMEHRKAFTYSAESLLSFIRSLITYFYLIYLSLEGRLTAGDFVLMIGMVSGFSEWLKNLIGSIGEFQRLAPYLDDYFNWLDMPEKARKEASCSMDPPEAGPEIVFDHVCFRYEGKGEDTLKDISFTVKPGEKLAIVGENGAGKTTLVKLLTGLYRPSSGRILLNGGDIINYDDESYFRLLSTVFQDIFLLPVDLAGNVSSRTHAKTDKQKVEQSLISAGIYEKVQKLPKGIYTPMQRAIRDDGIDLSGGEQQKVMLAKAIYKGGAVLVLDEPTAALDPIAESEVYQKYNLLTKGMTSFFVSHRLASTVFCDRIILVSNGRIAEEGTHEELLEKRERYWEMFRMQSKYYAESADIVCAADGGMRGDGYGH